MAEKKKTQLKANQSKTMENMEFVTMPASFARDLIKQVVYNPQKSSSLKTYTYSLYTKENIIKWLQSPSSSEQSLRNASNYMYLASMHYQRLIKYYSGLYTGAYVLSPVGFEGSKNVKSDDFAKNYYKVSKFIEMLELPALIGTIIDVALRDGAYYGVRWYDKTSMFIQTIDADYCKITSISNGTFLYSIDMSKISSKLEFFPAEFTEMYSNYLATGQKWQEVPANISFCVKGDSSIINFTVPPFSAVLPSLFTIANTESLQETAEEMKNYKMISGEVPVDDDGNPKIGWDLFTKYYNHIKNALGENVGLAITPFKLNAFAFDGKTGVADVDDISKAVANFWSAAGSSGLLHGVSNDTSGVTKLAIKNDETYVFDILKQIERIINRYLKTDFSRTSRFKITLLPITIYNKEDYVKEYKEAVSFGLGKSYYAAALGIPQHDIAGINFMENSVLEINELNPMKNSYTSSDESTGRPQSDDGNLTPSGEATRDNGANDNR